MQKISRIKTEESMRKEIIQKLKKSEEEIEKGEGIEAKVFFKEMRQKYEN